MAFGLFKKKKKEETADNRYLNLKIREVVKVSQDAVNVIFEKPEHDFNYQPGQFLTIIDTVKGKKIRRAYSLCTTPHLDEHPGVTVKRVIDGQMSNHINDTFKKGKYVEIMLPMGMFTTTYNAVATRQIFLFGGGSGITPLYSILRTILKLEPKSTVTLVYGNRDVDSVIFNTELTLLASENPNFKLLHVLENDSTGIAHYKGRPTVDSMMQIIQNLKITSESEIFICGPQAMMDVVTEAFKSAKIVDLKMHMESFVAGKTSPEPEIGGAPIADSKTSEVIIELNGNSFSLTLNKSKPVLEQALNANIDMPYSCQSGLCTACRGKCLEGEISIDQAEGLSQEELDAGFVLTCVGKPLSDFVRVEIG